MKEQSKLIKTSTLFQRLFKTPNLNRFIEENETGLQVVPFHRYIHNLCLIKGIVPERIIKQAGIERTYGHQLFNGTRRPSRDKVIQLAFGFLLNVDETQKMLKVAQKAQLYPRIKRDAVIIYCMEHHMDIMETQNILMELGLSLLGGQKDG